MLKRYAPLKNLKKRLPFWVVGFLVFIFLLKYKFILSPLWIIIFILIDEKIKEGYFFDPRDVKKPLTHENLAVITSAILAVIALLGRREKNDEDKDNRW
ncbi:MAG: hypothetical protein H0Z19_07245 [Archaeoglobus sp.]|uniref:hypothetical protein n=1 Tax=Archaeoglobus sp. TaxID=1872626 RepID=UPI001D80B9A6|nr:hypothetical protein [Archaeoglobus sp.]MBO8180259.1 hypothetical protein [Archaeoglobus sp.]